MFRRASFFFRRTAAKSLCLKPTKLQNPNAWCCDRFHCRDFCTCNIPKCLKNDDELQEERIGGYPAFEFLAIDFGVCHENELDFNVVDVFRRRQPNIRNVDFDSWPQDDVVAIRFMHLCDRRVSHDKQINNTLLKRFGPRNLRLFVAANAPISPTSLAKCSKLKWLDLANAHRHVNEETMSAVVKLPQLKRLSLDTCHDIPQESYKLLRDNTSIENLSFNGIANDAIVEEVSHMQSLVSLNLTASSDVSSSGIRSLVTNGTRLKSLSVGGCSKLTSADIAAIANISTLRSLDMRECEVKDSDVEQLATKLPQLELLKLTCNNLHDNAFAALGKLSSMRSLSLYQVQNTVSTDVFNAALGNLTQLRVLELNGSDFKNEHLQFLEKVRNLEVLRVGGSMKVDGRGLSHFRPLPKLRKLDLWGCGINNDGFAHLSHLTELESLSLNIILIDNRALQHISGMTKMRWLTLNHCGSITNEGLQFLRDMRDLEFLDLTTLYLFTNTAYTHVTATGIIRCVEKMDKLRFLCHSCDDKGEKAIRQMYPHVLSVRKMT